MPHLIERLFGATSSIAWPQVLPMIVLITLIPFLARRLKTPKRPADDPYANTEFDENGAVKKKAES